MKQEALLPGTDAIRRGTVEITRRGKRWLVRYKRRDGTVWQRQFADLNQAHRQFLAWADELQASPGNHPEEEREA